MAEIPIRKAETAIKKQQPKQEVVESPGHAVERTRTRTVFVPRTDIYENRDGLVVLADMPGVDEKNVEIHVENRVLTISGRVEDEEVARHRLAWQEYEAGDYERSFTLSNEVDVDRIEATVKQGMLRLVLPKAEAAKPRKIEVRAG